MPPQPRKISLEAERYTVRKLLKMITRAGSPEDLRTIFERANNTGKRMRSEEIFNALNSVSALPEAGEQSPAHILERLAAFSFSIRFGKIPPRTLQKTLVCVAGHNPKDELPAALKKPDAALPYERDTELALSRVVTFLQEECALPHALMLPYDLPIIILARFFRKFPTPNERSLALLSRWVWRGIATLSHETSNMRLSPNFSALKSEDEEQVVQNLLELVPRARPTEYPSSVAFSLHRNMRTRVELSALYRLGPLNVLTGEPLQADQVLAEDEAGKVRLATVPVSKDRSQWVAAHFFHPPKSDAGEEFVVGLRGASEAVLRSHAIPPAAYESVRTGDWDKVVQARRQEIEAQVRRTIDHFARWHEDDDGPSQEYSLLHPEGSEP